MVINSSVYTLGEVMHMNLRLRMLRKRRGMTQQQLARLLYISPSSVCEYERGNSLPTLPVLLKMADVFAVNLDYLLGRTDIKAPINRLEERLITRSGAIPIDGIFLLNDDDKEVIRIILKRYDRL